MARTRHSAKALIQCRPCSSASPAAGEAGEEKCRAASPRYSANFPGRHTQSTGKAGFSSSGSSDLWLENGSGVIMHLHGTSCGAMLTLGKDEIYIRMDQ